jgi:hypothetical protein
MKNRSTPRSAFLAWTIGFLFCLGLSNIYAQNDEKYRVRLRADYVKIMEGDAYLNIKATAKIEDETLPVPNIEIAVYNEVEGEEIILGNTKTNMKGESRFVLNKSIDLKSDSTNTFNLGISFNGNDSFKKASKSTSFKNAHIVANLITKDSVNYLTATLRETATDSLLVGESLDVQVQRLFRPLKIGEEFNFTDENGTILVPIEEGIPGVDGNLIIEVVLNDSDDYGTVKTIVNAPVGTPIVNEITFDQRKMWSARNKTPIFLLIFINLIIAVIYGLFIFLIFNLFRILKN